MQNTSTHTDYAKHQHTHRYMIYTNLYKCCNFIQLTNHLREHLIAQGLGSKLEAKTRVPESIFSVSRLISWRYELSEFHWQLEQLGIFPNSSIWYDVLFRVEYYWYIRSNWLMYNTTSKYIYVKKKVDKNILRNRFPENQTEIAVLISSPSRMWSETPSSQEIAHFCKEIQWK